MRYLVQSGKIAAARSTPIMKLNDWYDFVPAFVGTFGVLSISRTLGLKGARRTFDAGRPPAQTSISISVWSFDGTPKALQVLAAHLGAPPTPRSVVAYVPAVTSVGEALRLLDLADEDYDWIQITVLPDGDHVIFAGRKLHCKACPLDHD
jgi:hypothetical protein